jgi:hypothetical protein
VCAVVNEFGGRGFRTHLGVTFIAAAVGPPYEHQLIQAPRTIDQKLVESSIVAS